MNPSITRIRSSSSVGGGCQYIAFDGGLVAAWSSGPVQALGSSLAYEPRLQAHGNRAGRSGPLCRTLHGEPGE